MKVWILVSNDKYEMIEQMADSAQELADLCGVRVNTIHSAICHAKKRGTKSRYECVEIGELDGQ